MSRSLEQVKYCVQVEAEKVNSELVVVIALLEELKLHHPKAYPIAVKALQEMEL